MPHSFWLSSYNPLPIELTIYFDEAGRWPLAGPVWVGGVVALKKCDTSWFHDSKVLTPSQRSDVYQYIEWLHRSGDVIYGSWSATAHEIDRYGIIHAIQRASVRTLYQIFVHLFQTTLVAKLTHSVWWSDHVFLGLIQSLIDWCDMSDYRMMTHILYTFLHQPQSVFVFKQLVWDGNHTFGLDEALWCSVQTIIKGDSKVPWIGAASIIAKVERDHYMQNLDTRYKHRWFGTHKGYGTLAHRRLIETRARLTPEHRRSYLSTIKPTLSILLPRSTYALVSDHHRLWFNEFKPQNPLSQKPKLLLHICCAPDLSRPLHRLKHYFQLYLFRYNPNIHPKPEHDKRYAEFVKLFQLEGGDYEIVEDRYEPKEFFDAFVKHKELVDSALVDADRGMVLKQAGAMKERSDRCNPCYLMRLEQAAKQAQKLGITYFTSTLLISPKKLADKLFQYGLESQQRVTWTKFLRFDFAKKGWYDKASEITKQYGLYRQNYCGCGRTIPKKWETQTGYRGG